MGEQNKDNEITKAKKYFEEKRYPVMLVKNIKDTLQDTRYKQELYNAGYHFYSTIDISVGSGAEENFLWHNEVIFISKVPLEDKCQEVPWLAWKVITPEFIHYAGEIDEIFSVYVLSVYPESEEYKEDFFRRQNRMEKGPVQRSGTGTEETEGSEAPEKPGEATDSILLDEMHTNLNQTPAWKFYQRHKIKKDIRQFQEISRYARNL